MAPTSRRPADRARRPGGRWLGLGAVALAGALLVPATAGGAPPVGLHRSADGHPGGAPAEPARYVALGDSYTSGALVPPEAAGPAGCLRSGRDYPHLVARSLGLRLTDVSCSGATTADMAAPEELGAGVVPPQLDALTPSTAAVTMGIGGDDLGFAHLVGDCVAATPWGPTRVGWTCRSHFDPDGADQLAARITAIAPMVAAVVDDVHERAPHAAVFVVGYPDVLPGTGPGCWPRVALTRADLPYLDGVEVALNAMLRGVADGHGATYVDTYGVSAAHNACADDGTRWLQPLLPSRSALPLHPNATGEAALATLVGSAMRARLGRLATG